MEVTIPPDHVVHEGPVALGNLWHLPTDVWSNIWTKATGKTIRIAILDTGVASHPNLPTPVAARSFVRGESVDDRNGHGTHCAGTALGRDGIGVAPEAELMVGKVLSNGGSGSSQGIANGIEWAIDEGADLINLSLGGGQPYGPTNQAIDRAFSSGVIVNAAAGNSGFAGGRNTVGWPAKYAGCLCNGAIKEDGGIANFSSGGKELDWATPGQNIVSASIRGGLVGMSGTSMSAPFGTGLLALIVQLQRQAGEASWTAVDAVRAFLEQFCKDAGEPGKDQRFGYGIPKYTEIVEALQYDTIAWI